MRNVIIIVVLLVTGVTLTACSEQTSILTRDAEIIQDSPIAEVAQVETNIKEESVPQTDKATELIVKEGKLGIVSGSSLGAGDIRADGYPVQKDGFALWGGTVNITDVSRGWSGNAPLTIINGEDYARIFHLMIQSPTSSENYEPFPEKYYSWINIEDTQPKVPIGGSKQISITVSVPYDFPIELKGNKYIFGILVEDWSQTGFIQLALMQNWLISFAE